MPAVPLLPPHSPCSDCLPVFALPPAHVNLLAPSRWANDKVQLRAHLRLSLPTIVPFADLVRARNLRRLQPPIPRGCQLHHRLRLRLRGQCQRSLAHCLLPNNQQGHCSSCLCRPTTHSQHHCADPAPGQLPDAPLTQAPVFRVWVVLGFLFAWCHCNLYPHTKGSRWLGSCRYGTLSRGAFPFLP